RPQTFHDIVGQETVVRTLQNAIKDGRIHHAYLFSGVRGVGKTTVARILAKALNCEHGPAAEPDNTCTICREITEGIDLDVREITLPDLIARLAQICKAEGIEADRTALEIVARRGEGSVRDSLSLLDQIIAFSGRTVSADDVATILGLSDTNFFARIVTHIADGDHAAILEALQDASDGGRDFKMLYRDLLNFVRNLLLLAGGANEAMLAAAPEDLAT